MVIIWCSESDLLALGIESKDIHISRFFEQKNYKISIDNMRYSECTDGDLCYMRLKGILWEPLSLAEYKEVSLTETKVTLYFRDMQ